MTCPPPDSFPSVGRLGVETDLRSTESQPEDEMTADVPFAFSVGVDAFGGVCTEGKVLFGRGGVGLGERLA
jgi:hypothetical protein